MDTIKKIIIADDHSIVSRGLNYLISLNFDNKTITEVSSLSDLMKALQAEEFTHLILDLNFDDGNSIEKIPEITSKYPGLLILIYSMASEEVFGKKLMQYNISGFLSKKSNETEIVRALQVFLEGGIFLSKKLRASLENKNPDQAEQNVFQQLSIRIEGSGLTFKRW